MGTANRKGRLPARQNAMQYVKTWHPAFARSENGAAPGPETAYNVSDSAHDS